MLYTLNTSITSPSPLAYGYFGYSVAISGNGLVLAVGEPNGKYDTTTTGLVHIYDRVTNNWVYRNSLYGGIADNLFGHRICLSSDGSKIFISYLNEGDVLYYKYDSINLEWDFIQSVFDPGFYSAQVTSLSLSGNDNRLLITCKNTAYPDRTDFRVFEYNSGLDEYSYLSNNSITSHTNCCGVINYDGNYVYISNMSTQGYGITKWDYSGSAYYSLDDVVIYKPDELSYFGNSIAINSTGNVLYVLGYSTVLQKNVVYVYRNINNSWQLVGQPLELNNITLVYGITTTFNILSVNSNFDILIVGNLNYNNTYAYEGCVYEYNLITSDVYGFEGYVKQNDAYVSRIVRVYNRNTGELLAQTTSGVDGHYTITNLLDSSELYAVCLDDDIDPVYNALIYDRIIPQLE